MRVRGSAISGVLLIALVLMAWEAVSRLGWVPRMFFPPVTTIGRALWALVISGELPREYLFTLQRVASAYLLAAALAVCAGVLMGYYRFWHGLLEPLVEGLRPLPVVAIIPVSILFLGIDDGMKVFIIAWGSFFPILVNTVDGVKGTEMELIETARIFRLEGRRILFKVILPAAAPEILTGMRISLAIALILAVITEMVAGGSGIGYFILDTERSFRVPEMFAGIFSLCLVGYALNGLFLKLEGRVVGWHRALAQRPEG